MWPPFGRLRAPLPTRLECRSNEYQSNGVPAAIWLRAKSWQGSDWLYSDRSVRDPTEQRPVVRDFIKDFKAKFNSDPTHLNAHAYDQIMLIADVVKRGAKDAQSIRDGFSATKDYSGVTGSVQFDKNNQNIKMDTVHYMETKPDLSWESLKWN